MQRGDLIVENITALVEPAQAGLHHLLKLIPGYPVLARRIRFRQVCSHFQNIQRAAGITPGRRGHKRKHVCLYRQPAAKPLLGHQRPIQQLQDIGFLKILEYVDTGT